jgi:lysophospholipase L1-like esterase
VVVAVAVAVGAAVWWRWLGAHRLHWRGRLAASIPVNSRYWRERKEEPGELLYVAIGDSAAQGIGASRPQHSYVGFIAEHIAAVTGRTVRVANLAISGGTVRMAIDFELGHARHLSPDVVTVSIGANDIAGFDGRGLDEERFGRDIRQLLDGLPAHAIVADLPSFYVGPSERQVQAANRILRDEVTARNLTLVPLYSATKRQGLWGILTQFAGDLFHPNDRGYRVWAAAFYSAVDARLTSLAP